jgi:putative addiction module CopG family antidote
MVRAHRQSSSLTKKAKLNADGLGACARTPVGVCSVDGGAVQGHRYGPPSKLSSLAPTLVLAGWEDRASMTFGIRGQISLPIPGRVCSAGEEEDHPMSLTLTPEVEEQIRHWIETGRYPDADAVVLQALQALEVQEQARFLKTRELVLAGLNRREGVELTPEVWEEIAREADEADRLGLPIRDEVQP